MFKNLTDFSAKRTTKEAIGFYIAYLALILVTSVLGATVLGIATGNQNSFEFGVGVGTMIATLSSLLLSYLILNAKRLLNSFGNILLLVLSGLLGFLGGGIFGLIPVAYLSTKKAAKK